MAAVAEKTRGFGVRAQFDPGMASHANIGGGLGDGPGDALAGGGTNIEW